MAPKSPKPLTDTWILVEKPPRERPNASCSGPWSAAPFLRLHILVGANNGAVEQQPLQVMILEGFVHTAQAISFPRLTFRPSRNNRSACPAHARYFHAIWFPWRLRPSKLRPP